MQEGINGRENGSNCHSEYRTYEQVSNVILAKKLELISLIQRHQKLFPRTDTISLEIAINCQGQFFAFFEPRSISFDSSLIEDSKEVLQYSAITQLPQCDFSTHYIARVLNLTDLQLSNNAACFEDRKMRDVNNRLNNWRSANATVVSLNRMYSNQLNGVISLLFSINQNGEVLFSRVVANTTGNNTAAEEYVQSLRELKFNAIRNPIDIQWWVTALKF